MATAEQAEALPTQITLKDPLFSAFLGWLIPGAGHLYQGRTGKGLLFMICILTTYFFGLGIGGGKVVYASWTAEDKRLPYLCQLGAGLPALPALIQARRKEPLFGGLMAPPNPATPDPGELAEWNKRYHRYFELGTVYTMIAGLLNLLAVYDAWGGPVPVEAQKKRKKKSDEPVAGQVR